MALSYLISKGSLSRGVSLELGVVLDDEDLAMKLFYAQGEINFHEVAHQYIQDTELRRSGGYRGLLRRTELKSEISAAVFAAKPPQILKPIVTSIGVHLILVEEIIPPKLSDTLRQKNISDLFSTWLKQQIEQADFVTNIALDSPNYNPGTQVYNAHYTVVTMLS